MYSLTTGACSVAFKSLYFYSHDFAGQDRVSVTQEDDVTGSKRMGGAFALFLGPLGTGGSAMNSVKLIAVFFLLASLMKATSWPLASSTFLQGTVTDQSAKQDCRYHGDAPEFGIKTERIRLPVSVANGLAAAHSCRNGSSGTT